MLKFLKDSILDYIEEILPFLALLLTTINSALMFGSLAYVIYCLITLNFIKLFLGVACLLAFFIFASVFYKIFMRLMKLDV